jgi:hypothetical protein
MIEDFTKNGLTPYEISVKYNVSIEEVCSVLKKEVKRKLPKPLENIWS